MPDPLDTAPHGDNRPSVRLDPVARLAALWKTFEESGAVSAYIVYRRQLTQLVRQEHGHGALPAG